jgi:hypothetical protein
MIATIVRLQSFASKNSLQRSPALYISLHLSTRSL